MQQKLAGATIYEVNIRQYTTEGTFAAFSEHLPRLGKLGVDILWLMPIHPIGVEKRKGTLGSYYAITDYEAVNPEFGTDADFRKLVQAAHDAGMIVILDWVANHTAPDHIWTKSHPDYFTKDEAGNFVPPNPDWSDTIDLNYDNPKTHRAMLDAMKYWVREFDIDGFRCDVAELVPREFWQQAIPELRKLRPLFLLAEGYEPWLYDVGFDATYGWGLADRILEIKNGTKPPSEIREHVEKDAAKLNGHGTGPYRMYFTTNHDWNSWNGVARQRLGPAWEAATVLTFTLPGMPLIYSGQEAGLNKQLQFFEKDQIDWQDHKAANLYQKLAKLKQDQPALHHGPDSGKIEFLATPTESPLVAFRRTNGTSEVIVIANMSAAEASLAAIELESERYNDLEGNPTSLPQSLPAWGWLALQRTK